MDLDEAQVERATISMIQSLVEQRLLGSRLYYHCRTLHFYRYNVIWNGAAMVIISPCILHFEQIR